MKMPTHHLFVYGTLRRDLGHPMHAILKHAAHFVDEATVRGTLYDLGAYPALVVGEDHDQRVTGELYALELHGAPAALEALDAYEGCAASDPEPHEYRREILRASLADGSVLAAWTYVLNRPHGGLTLVAGGDYVAWLKSRS
jgi:gamma-glutamylcyclotransferase (GGCT)/AIG2-like uncharacterized protein YtfP